MIDHRYTITFDAPDEVESLLMRFERDRDRGPVHLDEYTPLRDDPAYDSVLTELARIDFEYPYNNGIPPDAKPYVESFPHVFKDDHLRTQLAFEEYRLRRRGGDDVTGTEIGNKYDVDGSRWPKWNCTETGRQVDPFQSVLPTASCRHRMFTTRTLERRLPATDWSPGSAREQSHAFS